MPRRAGELVIPVRLRRMRDDSYPIRIGHRSAPVFPRWIRALAPAHRYFLVTDTRVRRLHGRRFLAMLRSAGLDARLLAVPPGERSKSRDRKAWLEDRILAMGGGRDTTILALGGGMVGDLAGFTAATFARGVPFVPIPTTLLAMVDAAVGGKTAVDHPRGKNLIGALHQPRAVLCDVGFLGTLPDRELRSGLAEVVKAAVVGDARLFRFLERSPGALLARHPETLVRVITAACRVKVRVVTADPEEEGLRAVLNFGHTLGHAVELLARYRLTHGEAVAIGMALESRAGEAAGIVAKGEAARIASVLRSFSLPTALPAFITPDRLLAAARTDKKTRKGELRFALPRNLGRMTDLDRAFTVRLAENLLRQALAPSTRRQRLAPSWQ